ncbi:MAG: ShlB/FhaC/HecB family hemolysin secretion/activation protein [Verrucomicrobia bacterium]|nr:ShlB/FhaC/HecB family hemolysin secretion/activation protein [Verrucomicrobiota bacterium]
MKRIQPAFLTFFLPTIAFTAPNPSLPPPAGSAGVVERQIQQEYETTEVPPEKEIPLIEVEEPKEQLRIPEGIKVHIDSIEFEGNTAYTDYQLRETIRDCVPADCTMQDIKEICAKVRAKYIADGYFLARVYPPPQEIHDGKLKVAIIEGKLGKVSVVGNKYYQTDFIEAYFRPLQGEAVNYNQYLKTLLLLNENSDMHAGAVFKKGEVPGTCDLIVRVNDARPAHLYLNTNNYGSGFNSRQRSGGRFDWGNIMLDGDKLSFTGVLGSPVNQLRFADVHYNFLLSKPKGIRIDFSYLYSDFRDSAFHSLHLKGRSEIGSVQVDFPHLRTRRLNTDYYLAFDAKRIQNFAVHQTVSEDKLRIVRAGLNIDYIDGKKGRNIWEFWYYQGIPSFLDGSGVVSSKPTRAGAGGQFSIATLGYKRLQQLPQDTMLWANFYGQFSGNKLPQAQQIYIGGIDTVRGYPNAAGLGDFGYYFNLEARMPIYGLADKKVPWSKKTWKEFLQFVAFLDHGQIFLHGSSPNEIHHVHMTSMGVGARMNGPWGIDLSFDVGFPLSHQTRTSHAITYFKVSWNPF